MKRQFNIFISSGDFHSNLRRQICIDIDKHNSKEIRDFLFANRKEFRIVAERVLTLSNMYYDRYKREFKNSSGTQVTAFTFFDIQNTRIYCQEMTNHEGEFFIICAKLFDKKSQKNNKTNKPLLENIASYEYSHKP